MKRSNHFKRFHAFALTCIISLFTLLFYLGTLTPFASLYSTKETRHRGMSHIRYGVQKEIYSMHKGSPLRTVVTAKESYIKKGEDGLRETLIGLSDTLEEITPDGSVITRQIAAPKGFLNYTDKTLFAKKLEFNLREKNTPLFSGIANKALISFTNHVEFNAETIEGDGHYAP